MSIEGLSKKEIKIFNKIRANSGLSKEDVVRMMKDDLSRVPTLATLRELENKGLIAARRDKTNRQTYKLFVNDENIIAILLQELQELKENFSKLIDKLSDRLQKQGYPKSKFGPEGGKSIVPTGILYPFRILFDVIIALNHRMLFIWPLKISDLDTLDEAFLLVFSTINDIRREMVKKLRPYFPPVKLIFQGKTKNKTVGYPEFVGFYNMAFLEPLLQTLKEDLIPGGENEQRLISDYLRKNISLDAFLGNYT